MIRLEPQHRQHSALLRAADRDVMAVHAGLDGSKDVEQHPAARVGVLVHDQSNHLLQPRARVRRAGVHTLPEAALRPLYDAD